MIQHPTVRLLVCILAVAIAAGSVPAQLDSVLDELIEKQIAAQVENALIDSLERQIEDAVGDTLDFVSEAAHGALQDVVEVVPDPDAPFVEAVDEQGYTIERGVWVLLVAPDRLARIERQGLVVRERRPLKALGLVLIRVDAPADGKLAEAARRLAVEAPGTEIDHNHVYRPQADRRRPSRKTSAAAPGRGAVRLAIGIIDSSVAASHEALRGATILQEDFVPFARPRPIDHGTAVASILVGDAPSLRGWLPGARLYAASVFFQDDAGRSAATTSSLVQALDWLLGTGVRVINMSLAGPPNRVLEAAIGRLAERSAIVVAAVGNAGPVGRPLYPAAYDTVIGVTAVDAQNSVYLYANRGPQVVFAALGVDVPVARGDGGYASDSGTSLAAPCAAAILVRALAANGDSPDGALSALKTTALDLGEPGFDETFGFGLIQDGD